MNTAKPFLLLIIFTILSFGYSQNWQYARLTTNIVGGELVTSWTSPTEKIALKSGILFLAERVMGRLINDTDDAFIVFLNHLGQQGWELILVETTGNKKDYLFKRLEPSVVFETH